jgi:hypothetical protein
VKGEATSAGGGHGHGHAHHDHDEPTPAVLSLETQIEFAGQTSPAEAEQAIRAFCCRFARELGEQGCRLIGHVKGAVETTECGALFFSLTTFEGPPQVKGGLTCAIRSCRFTLNAIVYFIDVSVVEASATKAIADCLGRRTAAGIG